MDLNTIKAVIFGHAVGDALGVPVEFASREELDDAPVTDMHGFGTYPYPAGSWSDDTSMSLATLDSLSGGKIDLDEIMRNFGKWYYEDEYTPTGEMFDVGNTCSFAIHNYFKVKCDVYNCGLDDEQANGNGSLMRIHPVVLFLYARDKEFTLAGIDTVFAASALTHAHFRSKIACGIYAYVLMKLLNNPTIESVHKGLAEAKITFECEPEFYHFSRIFDKNFADTPREKISSGGYVVHTLEAALWCLLTTNNYKDCVLKAVNLGDDTDTVAAVAGGLAGALYGYDAIPEEWLNTLIKREYIAEMCERACKSWTE